MCKMSFSYTGSIHFDTMYQESACVLPRYRQWETKPEFISGDSWLWLQWPSSWNGPWWCVLHVCSMTTRMSTWIHWQPFSSCDQLSQAIHSKRASVIQSLCWRQSHATTGWAGGTSTLAGPIDGVVLKIGCPAANYWLIIRFPCVSTLKC